MPMAEEGAEAAAADDAAAALLPSLTIAALCSPVKVNIVKT